MSIRGGGSICAIATCDLYSGKTKRSGMTDISFHRFPKDHDVQKEWIQKCKRSDDWTPSKSYICSKHFKSEDFHRDFKAELMGTVAVKRLKPGSVPTLNLPSCLFTESPSAVGRRSRIEAKSIGVRVPFEVKTMVKKRKSVLKSSAQVVDSPMKEPRMIRGNHLEKARNSLNEALDIIVKKEQKKVELSTESDVINLEEIDAHKRLKKIEPKYEVKDSLVLKLRDRSIDLASFTDSTAMYPICRAWIKNDPLSARQVKVKKIENLERLFKSENDSSTVEDYVYKLPPPNNKSDIENGINSKMPKNLPKDSLTTLDVKTLSDDIPPVSELLKQHRQRWVCVRQQWIKFSNENEARYAMSKSILNSMLNKDNSV